MIIKIELECEICGLRKTILKDDYNIVRNMLLKI